MNDKTKRLAAFVQELRGSLSKGQFARDLNVDRSTISIWESARAYPESENLSKLARLKGWSLEQLESYLLEGELPTEDPLEQILRKIRTLPSESVAQVAAIAATTLAERMGVTDKLSLKT
jgi:transcriptional regulator with XRE-family HTH domain